MDKDDKEEGLLKRLKKTEDKNKELLNVSRVANKGVAAKNAKNSTHF